MTVPEYLGFLLDLNAKLPSDHKLTDQQLAVKLVVEFNGARTARKYLTAFGPQIFSARSSYNLGRLSWRIRVPRQPSFRYGRLGILLTNNGLRPYTNEEILKACKKQLQRWEVDQREIIFAKEPKTPPPNKKKKYRRKGGSKPVGKRELRRRQRERKALRKKMAKLYWLRVAQERKQARLEGRESTL